MSKSAPQTGTSAPRPKAARRARRLRFAAVVCGIAVQASGAPAQVMHVGPAAATGAAEGMAESMQRQITELKGEIDDLKIIVGRLKEELSVERQQHAAVPGPEAASIPGPPAAPRPVVAAAQTTTSPSETTSPAAPTPPPASDPLHGVTINAVLDGYYTYNLNNPIGRVNSLRAYDVSSNNFSLNQAAVVLESAPDLAARKRWGLRLDLQFGQATETLQGNAANELRPNVYRNIFQAYGTYIIPLGSGITVDVGKWASSLGYEGNYTKDQFNYSRSFWFDFLPFYHTGVRTNYKLNDKLAANIWITNGTEQTEAFNNFKDILVGFVLTPTPTLTWTGAYYLGQEHPDIAYVQNPTPAQLSLPSQQGSLFQPVVSPPKGKLNILDTYAAWQATPRLTLAGEADYVEERLYSFSPSQETWGGAVYLAYQAAPAWSFAARAEYMNDRGGLFAGARQTLWEGTLTVDYHAAENFILYGEVRRDASSRAAFLRSRLGLLATEQPTIGVGAVWWFGRKEGAW